MNLKSEIENLISLKKEGEFWDFKEKHHKNFGEFLHDVLCLSNVIHDGPRYLIYGVSNGFKVIGVENDSNRKKQADVISFLSDNRSKFAFNCPPNVGLEIVNINGKEVDVLIVENQFRKPYYTTQKIDCVRAHYIYTRELDRNTPRDRSADPILVEKMWSERFGLNLPIRLKMQKFLCDHENWEQGTQKNGNAYWFYKAFPEYVVKVENAADHVSCTEEWTCGEIQSGNNYSGYYAFYYAQTRLTEVRYVSFDDKKKNMVAPDWTHARRGRLYFYRKDSFELSAHRFQVAIELGIDHSKNLSIGSLLDSKDRQKVVPEGETRVPIPVTTQKKIDQFLLEYDPERLLSPIKEKAEQYRVFVENQFRFQKWLSSNN